MYCPYCRMALKEGATRCGACGAPVGEAALAVASSMSDAGGGLWAAPGLQPLTSSTEQTRVRYAGFWRRFAAFVLDSIIVTCASVILFFVLGLLLPSADFGSLAGREILLDLIGFLLQWFYFAGMESAPTQATLGKMAFGIIVTDSDGRRISFSRATGRYFAKILSALVLMIGYLMAAFTPRKQALHDMISGTLVICEP